MTMNDGEERRRVLYVIVCAAPPASDVHELVKLAQAAGWEVCVIATPAAMTWIDATGLAELTGHDVRSEYRLPGEAKSLPEADAIAVAPATFNTVNKFRAGIARQHGRRCALRVPTCRCADHPCAQRKGRPCGASCVPGQPPRTGVLGGACAGAGASTSGVRMAPWEAILEAVESHVR